MVFVVLGTLLCLALAVAVLGVVAVPARRSGRDLLTERGEQVARTVRRRAPAGHPVAETGADPLPVAPGAQRP